MAFLPAVSAQHSAHASDSNLNQNSNVNTQNGSGSSSQITDGTGNNMILQSSSLISSSSSANSSTLPSPALINNGSVLQFSQINDLANGSDYQQQHSWPSGASKVARVANKIVNSINSVSTPKTARKLQQSIANNNHQELLSQTNTHQQHLASLSPKNFSNESQSSSCNSSGPNSPSYLKHQLQLQQQLNNNTDKKSSSSSTSISSGAAATANNQQRSNYFNYNTQNLAPIATGNNSTNYNMNNQGNTTSPLTRNVEFFENPTIKRTTSVDSNQLDDSLVSDNISVNLNGSINADNNNNSVNMTNTDATDTEKLINKETIFKEPLDLKQSNNSTVVDSNNDGDTDDPENTNQSEYDQNEADISQYIFTQDLKQFNITYEEITDKVEIGRGRFGCVYKAQWHGPHAVKEIDFDENLTEDSKELLKFKQEVLNLKKTRHANLILIVGACMKPPKCAIVMSLCRGVSLYKYLHTESYQKPNFDWTIDIATQIAQGMGYLHNKGMIHKDLRSKNIFIDGSKAVIADFGLYSITRLCKKLKRRDLLPITKECVFYMAPELVRLLGTAQVDGAFSQASDVFSFGTVWYELFCFEYPFQSNSTETVIYLIGNGLKNISPNIQIPKEFKNILLKCWSKDASSRPNFSHLLETFRAIPKRTKIFRSPSHPVHIGRSLEALHSISALNDMKN